MGDLGTSKRVGDRALVVLEVLLGVGVLVAIAGPHADPAAIVFFLCTAAALGGAVLTLTRMVTSLSDEALDVPGREVDHERVELEQEKLLLLQGIKELEADFQTGKVDRGDYEHLRGRAEARALEIIEKLKNQDHRYRAKAEALVKERLGQRPHAEASAAAVDAPPVAALAVAAPPVAALAVAAPAMAALAPASPAAPVAGFDDRPTARATTEAGAACAACQFPAEANDRFCGGCGRPFAAEGLAPARVEA